MNKIKVLNEWRNGGLINDKNYFGCKLKEICQKKGIALTTIAEILCVSNTYITHIVEGNIVPGPFIMFLISKIINEKIEDIWQFKSDVLPEITELSEHYRAIEKIQKKINRKLKYA